MPEAILPAFALNYLNSLRLRNMSSFTIDTYTIELAHFFNFLCEHREDPDVFTELRDRQSNFAPLPSSPQDITLDDFKKLTHWHIASYLAFTKEKNSLNPRTMAKKQAAIKSLYRYLFNKDLIEADISQKLDSISLPEEDVIAMEPEEVATLVDIIEKANGQTKHQKEYTKYTQKRDLAIILSFLGSGLRLMELQRLDVEDVDFSKNLFHIVGKRNKITIQPFNDEAGMAIKQYLEEERPRLAQKSKDNALFLSLQGKRLSRRAIQNIVEKYIKILESKGFAANKYTTHKLRATCATELLRVTGNLALVQDYMRHKDPKTTRKYAKITDEELRRAAGLINFR